MAGENEQNLPRRPDQTDPDTTQAGEESPNDPGTSNNNASPSEIDQQMANATLDGAGSPAATAEAPAQSPTTNGTSGNGVGPPTPILTLNGPLGSRRLVRRPYFQSGTFFPHPRLRDHTH